MKEHAREKLRVTSCEKWIEANGDLERRNSDNVDYYYELSYYYEFALLNVQDIVLYLRACKLKQRKISIAIDRE